jgi:hypothetical protein
LLQHPSIDLHMLAHGPNRAEGDLARHKRITPPR